jgi:hypothetical protein
MVPSVAKTVRQRRAKEAEYGLPPWLSQPRPTRRKAILKGEEK